MAYHPYQLLGILLLIAQSCSPHWEGFLALGSRLIQTQPPLGEPKFPWYRDTVTPPLWFRAIQKGPPSSDAPPGLGSESVLKSRDRPPLSPHGVISLENPPIPMQQAALGVYFQATLRPTIFLTKYNKGESHRRFTAETLSTRRCDADICPYQCVQTHRAVHKQTRISAVDLDWQWCVQVGWSVIPGASF